MNCAFVFTRVLACALFLGAVPAIAHAEPIYVPIDGSKRDYSPKDFGYHIQVTKSGGLVHVYVELDEAAARSFMSGRL